jgi:hypothetical protein
MAIASGKEGAIFVEVGVDQTPYTALTAITTPAERANRYFKSTAEYFSAQEKYKPLVRLDGIKTGCVVSPHADADTVNVSDGTYYIKGVLYTLADAEVADIARPAILGNVIVTALSIDADLNVNKTAGVEGTASTTRGAAGGKPFIPVDEVLVGYVTAEYVSSSAGAVFVNTDIDTDSAEYAALPGVEIIYHDGQDNTSNPYGENVGVIKLSSALTAIHSATPAGGTNVVRNVYAKWWEPSFEEIPDVFDANADEAMSELVGMAYQYKYEQKVSGTPSWSGGFNFYWDSVNDIMHLIKNSRRFFKVYRDVDGDNYYAGAAILTISRSIPKDGVCDGAANLSGSGPLHVKTT